MKNRGVTLVELLIVIVVVGIITGFTVTQVGSIIDNVKRSGIRHEIEAIEDAARFYSIDVGERPYGTMSGAGTCATWNQDSINTFVSGTRSGSAIDGWGGPYISPWPEETPLGGCYVYRSYLVGSQNWARNNWKMYSDNTKIGTYAPLDKDIEIVMVRFYPLTDAAAIAKAHEVAEMLLESVEETQVIYVSGQAVIGYYIKPRD